MARLEEMSTVHKEYQSIGERTREWLITTQNCPLLITHGLGLVGWSRAREGFYFSRMNPPFGQVLACVGGSGEVLIENTWHPCVPGMVYVTPPQVHHAYRVAPGESWRVAWVHVEAGLIRGTTARLTSADTETYGQVIRGLYAEVMGSGERDPLEHWLHLLSVYTRRLAGSADTHRLYPLWEIVLSDLSYPWTVAELATKAAMSEEHLRRLSLTETGVSPMRYVTRLRMRHAESLLVSGRYSIAQVAVQVGYENPFAFTTAFKRVTGLPPSQYRALSE